MSEMTIGAGVAAGTVATLGPVTDGYAYILAGAVFGCLIALGELGRIRWLDGVLIFVRSVGLSALVSGAIAAGLTHWFGAQIMDTFVTPQGLLAGIAAFAAWILADWRGKLRALSEVRRKEG